MAIRQSTHPKRDISSVTGGVSENGDSIQVVPVTHMITGRVSENGDLKKRNMQGKKVSWRLGVHVIIMHSLHYC